MHHGSLWIGCTRSTSFPPLTLAPLRRGFFFSQVRDEPCSQTGGSYFQSSTEQVPPAPLLAPGNGPAFPPRRGLSFQRLPNPAGISGCNFLTRRSACPFHGEKVLRTPRHSCRNRAAPHWVRRRAEYSAKLPSAPPSWRGFFFWNAFRHSELTFGASEIPLPPTSLLRAADPARPGGVFLLKPNTHISRYGKRTSRLQNGSNCRG